MCVLVLAFVLLAEFCLHSDLTRGQGGGRVLAIPAGVDGTSPETETRGRGKRELKHLLGNPGVFVALKLVCFGSRHLFLTVVSCQGRAVQQWF